MKKFYRCYKKAENVEIVPIEKKDFDHGGTRNKGGGLVKGRLYALYDAGCSSG